MNYTEITPLIVVGGCPRNATDIDRLHQELGVSAIVNLQTSGDFSYCEVDWEELQESYSNKQMQVRRVPVLDFNRGDLRRRLPDCIQTLNALIQGGHKVFVHCNSGVNRAPSVAITYLHWINGMALDEAIRHVTQLRKCDPYLDAIREATSEQFPRRDGKY